MTRITSLCQDLVILSYVSDPFPRKAGVYFIVSLLQLHMKSRTNSDVKVITLRQSIKASLKNAASVAFYDPACDARHLATLIKA